MNPTHDQLVTRESILNLLSADELARVCTAETQPALITGEDYLDLKHLDLGIRRARPYLGVKGSSPMGQVLPKSAVATSTWARIIAQLPPR
ncbi:MAG: hypothetical protein Q8L48_10350 [Archangium sp.]|nr:hypothetical protein [Archangium sp.]